MKDTSNAIIAAASHAAENASAAALSAADAAKTAAANAAIAAKAASDSATTIAVVATDTSWMKKSLEGIEVTLNDMQKAYVTASQHMDLIKRLDNHDGRIEGLETNNTRTTVMLSIGVGLLTIVWGLVVYHLFQK